MQLFDFFDPVDVKLINESKYTEKSRFSNKIVINNGQQSFDDIGKFKIAIIGVSTSKSKQKKLSVPDMVRQYLYSLFVPYHINIIDLGNLKQGKTPSDITYGIREVVHLLSSKKIISVIIGDNNNLPFGSYLAYEESKKPVNIVSIDSTISLKQKNMDIEEMHYLPRIVLRNNNCLFNYSLLGYQTYYVNPDDINTLSRLFFDAVRLGVVQSNVSETEPLIRDADIVAMHLRSVQKTKHHEFDSLSPNGIDSQEFCQLARYAGISDRLTSFGVYGINNVKEEAITAAQTLWYFFEGYSQRKHDYPARKPGYWTKFHVNVGKDTFITFYKSPKSERWWMEVPYPKSGFVKSLIISCSISDYQKACIGEVPDRWWKFYQKIC